jgi:hypothetical protein
MSDKQIIWTVVIAAVIILPPSIFFATRQPAEQALDLPSGEQQPKSATPSISPPSQPQAAARPANASTRPEPREAQSPALVDRPVSSVAPMPPRQPPVRAPIASKVKVRVSGGAWVIRRDGRSDLLRGLRVSIVNDTVPADVLRPLVLANAKELDQEATDARNQAKEMNELGAGFGKHDEERAARLDAQAANGRHALKGLPTDLDQLAALKLLTASHHYGIPSLRAVAAATQIASTRTNVDGKYMLTAEITPGSYYLHAEFDSTAGLVQWLIPLDASRDIDSQIDLFNETAAVIKN